MVKESYRYGLCKFVFVGLAAAKATEIENT